MCIFNNLEFVCPPKSEDIYNSVKTDVNVRQSDEKEMYFRSKRCKKPSRDSGRASNLYLISQNYNCGPEGINAIASSLSQYCSKFLMYFAASDFAFVSHSATSA